MTEIMFYILIITYLSREQIALRKRNIPIGSENSNASGLHKPEHGAQLNRSKPHTLTGACRTPKPV